MTVTAGKSPIIPNLAIDPSCSNGTLARPGDQGMSRERDGGSE